MREGRIKTHLGRTANVTVVLVLALIVSLNSYYYFYWMADDAYISIRYALNFVNSGKLFYNVDENTTGLVQGYSNPGMIPIYVLLLKFTSDVMLALKVLGTVLFFCTSLLVFFLCRRFETPRTLAFVGSVVVAASPILGVPATSGLETIFLCFFLTLSLWLLTSENNILQIVSALSFAYCASMRPEGLVLVVALFTVFMVAGLLDKWAFSNASTQTNRLFAGVSKAWIFVFSGSTSTFLIWQYSTYNSFFPNTSTVKTAGTGIKSFFTLDRYKYFFDFFTYNPSYTALWILAFAVFLLGLFRRSVRSIKLFALILCTPGIALAVLGRHDYFPNFRYLAPYFPIFVFFVILNISELFLRSKSKVVLYLTFIAVSGAGLAIDIRTDSVLNNKFSFSSSVDKSNKDFENFRKFNGSYWTPFPRQSDLFALFTPENGIVSYGNIGRPGINSMDIQIIDSAGLVTKDFALFRSRNPDGLESVTSLLTKHKPVIYVVGDGDQELQNLVKPLIADDYLEKDWLQPDREKVFVSKNLFADDGGSIVPVSAAIKRQKDTHHLLPHDYLAAARYRDLLYLGQRTHELKKLLTKFQKHPDYWWYAATLPEVLEFPFDSARTNDSIYDPAENHNLGKASKLSIGIDQYEFLTFKAFNFNIRGKKNSTLNLKAEICTTGGCTPIGNTKVIANDNGDAKLSLVFDRFKLFFPIQPVQKIINPEMVYEYAGLPMVDVSNHAALLFPDGMPQKVAGVVSVSIVGATDADLTLAGIR